MHLFLYGVLMPDIANPTARRLLSGIGPGQAGVAQGLLYAVHDPLGAYPALLPGEDRIRGSLHEAGHVDLGALDRFEGVDPGNPAGGEYCRRTLTVRTDAGAIIAAQAYIYNRPVAPGLEPIRHGDFARWLRESGNRPFAG